MTYRDLETLYHMDSSAQRDSHARQLLAERVNSSSTFDLGFETATGKLFLAVPRELNALTQKILRRERKVSNLMRELPGIAGREVLRSLVVDEVIMSNSIESIHSTRRQIEVALAAAGIENLQVKRFREFAKLYMDLSYGNYKRPETIEDIRLIYDQVMAGEKLDDPPDGKLFRKEGVQVMDGLKDVHDGIVPESKIIEAMQAMLELVESPEIPELYSALVSHFIFEYAHPFYDGNGRTGRYLLSLFLEAPLSKPTALSLSRVIAENKSQYYQAFRNAESPLNHGELTFFIITMHELILKAQDELIERLTSNIAKLEGLRTAITNLKKTKQYPDKEILLIFGLAQQRIFGISPEASVSDLANLIERGNQQTRKYLASMEERGITRKARGRNPVTFVLTDSFYESAFPDETAGEADATSP